MSKDRAVIGYTLEPIYEIGEGMIATQAFVICSSCNHAISGQGGPKYNAICLKCVEHFDLISNLIQKGNQNV